MCHVSPTMRLSGMTCRQKAASLWVATINLQTKFKVSNYTYYENLRSCAKCRNWDSLGRLGVTQGHRQSHHSIEHIRKVTIRLSTYDFLFDFNRNHASILYRFRDVAGYLSKVADFDPPHLHSTPPWGVTPVEFRGNI